MMRPLILGSHERAIIGELRRRASQNVMDSDTLKELAEGFNPTDPSSRRLGSFLPQEFTIDIPLDYRVTFTLEQQPKGLSRHISISLNGTNRAPSLEAVVTLCDEFEFQFAHDVPLGQAAKALQQAIDSGVLVYPETYKAGRIAINIIEKV